VVSLGIISGARIGPTLAATPDTSADQAALAEVVVTAQKREERLQDVPIPVTALQAQALVDTGHVRLQDYYESVPGLTYAPDAQGSNAGVITLRGLNSSGGNPTVAILVDGMPFGSDSSLGAGAVIPDFDPSELQRVEVLRGPQGTLYGASSLGGVINFITTPPSTDTLNGRVQADINTIRNSNGPGYGWRGAVNVPLSDTFAVRLGAFTRHDAGYVDNVETGRSGVNSGADAGGRLAALWRPNSTVSVQLNAILQNNNLQGSPEVFLAPGYADLQQSREPGTGWVHQGLQDYNAIVKAVLNGVELTSLSSYNINRMRYSFDYSVLQCCLGPTYADVGAALLDTRRSVSATEELRLQSKLGDRLDWQVGGFYTHQAVPVSQQDPLINPTTGAPTGVSFGATDWWSTYQEASAFADFTVHFSSQFDIQFGGRESFIKQHFQETDLGPLTEAFEDVPSPAIYPAEDTRQSVFTYLVTPRFKFSDHLMLYARIASGYRPGGPNANDVGALVNNLPPSFGADKTKNYEVGIKGDAFDRKLSFDASAYYIDWRNIQLSLLTPNGFLNYLGNASGAKSQGVELSVESRPMSGLTLSAWAAWNDAELTSAIPKRGTDGTEGIYGSPGDPLPSSARFSANATAQEEFPITEKITGYVGGTVAYVGERVGNFVTGDPVSNPRQLYPAYTKTDLRAGAKFAVWTVNLFANNVTDRRGLLSGGNGQVYPQAFILIAPRTLGLSVAREF